MDTKRELKFEDLPQVIIELTEKVNALCEKVESLSSQIGERPRPALSIDVASTMVQKSKSTIYKLVAANAIPFHKQGKRLYFFENELMEWIAEKKTEAEKKSDYEAAHKAAIEYITRRARRANVIKRLDSSPTKAI